MNARDRGRADLAAWLEHQPTNFYHADRLFRATLARLAGPDWLDEMGPRLDEFGAVAATTLDEAAALNNRPQNLPRLERWDSIGRRIEEVEHHPSYHVCGAAIYETGMMGEYARPGGFLRALSFFQLSSMCGEAGHNCPVACTAGIVKAVGALGSEELKDRFLSGLYSNVYAERLDGAQFLTEVQGGSDVGANAVVAERADDGTWRITGEKWFCSNAHADLILMTARIADPSTGTRGLGLFLVPRKLDDGSANGFRIRRLKDKLGTRSMASGEIDFDSARAWALGDVESGFKNMMRYVINTSRIYNAVNVSGSARRSLLVARGYAQHRRAFGTAIGNYSLVQETVAQIDAGSSAILVGTFELIALLDALDRGELDATESAFLRLAINVNKVRTSKTATECAMRGIEVLGGNGAIESFSILPRLLRDAIVCENWEGTHNTLAAQTLRDMHRYKMHEPYLDTLGAWFSETTHASLAGLRERGAVLVENLRSACNAVLAADTPRASLRMRTLVDELAWALYAASLGRQADYELGNGDDSGTRERLEYFWNWRLRTLAPAFEFDELERIGVVSGTATGQ